jgi:regulatory protein
MKKLTYEQAKQKVLHYCAYQERAHSEVKNKLFEFGLCSNDVDELLAYLITEGFLNEERFAKTFTGGKFRLKKWGRLKIIHELESKGLTKNCIRIGLKEIDELDYENTLAHLLQEKAKSLREASVFVLRDKLSKYAIHKGFEPELVWKKLKELFPG